MDLPTTLALFAVVLTSFNTALLAVITLQVMRSMTAAKVDRLCRQGREN
jgi:hypothetical protein